MRPRNSAHNNDLARVLLGQSRRVTRRRRNPLVIAPNIIRSGKARRREARRARLAVCLDFDGVLHAGAWAGAPELITGKPLPGARDAVRAMRGSVRLYCLSARTATPEGLLAVGDWLLEHEILGLEVVATKPVADVYVDDRGIRFDGWPRTLTLITRALGEVLDG